MDSFSKTPPPSRGSHLKNRPISLTVLEKYFSDIVQSITSKNFIEFGLLSKIETMKDVLKDCFNTIEDLSLEIFLLINSVFNDLQQVQVTGNLSNLPVLLNKLLQVALIIETDNFRSTAEPAAAWNSIEEEVDESILKAELEARVAKVTVRVLNMWKKIVCTQKESGIICCCFLLLYCEIDRTIRVSPYFKVKFDKAVNVMKDYCSNPGYVVTVVRRTRDYIERGLISSEIISRIQSSLHKISPASVKSMDKTLTGLILYELVVYSVKYYNFINNQKNEPNSAEVKTSPFKSQESINHELSFNHSHFESFPTTFSVELNLSPIKSSPEEVLVKSVQGPILCEQHSKKPSKPQISSIKPSQSSSKITKSPIKIIKKANFLSNPLKKSQSPQKIPLRSNFLKFKNKSVESSPSPSQKIQSKYATPQNDLKKNSANEEIQYQKFIEEFFRKFLSEKLAKKSEVDCFKELKDEEKINLNKEKWMKEFEELLTSIRLKAIDKLAEEKRFFDEISKAKKYVNSEV
jgi:hypothetical protein